MIKNLSSVAECLTQVLDILKDPDGNEDMQPTDIREKIIPIIAEAVKHIEISQRKLSSLTISAKKLSLDITDIYANMLDVPLEKAH